MRINKEQCALVVIDIQEKLFPHINSHNEVARKAAILIEGIQALKVPVVVTEQYVKGLGSTIDMISDVIGDNEPIEKTSFSCCGEGLFNIKIEEHYKENIILCGIETHVCVLQTALDLKEAGHNPIVVVDAVGSRNNIDKEIALKRMETEGIRLTTVESILFELCKISGTDTFKTISKLVK
ncbi:MAG: hydrolase [Salibacteraceae bacterium]